MSKQNKKQKRAGTLQSKESAVVMQNLIIKPARVESADVGTWRKAINNAKLGNRIDLYNLYDNLLTDPVLADTACRMGAKYNSN